LHGASQGVGHGLHGVAHGFPHGLPQEEQPTKVTAANVAKTVNIFFINVAPFKVINPNS